MLICIESLKNCCDFPGGGGGVRTPYPPASALVTRPIARVDSIKQGMSGPNLTIIFAMLGILLPTEATAKTILYRLSI